MPGPEASWSLENGAVLPAFPPFAIVRVICLPVIRLANKHHASLAFEMLIFILIRYQALTKQLDISFGFSYANRELVQQNKGDANDLLLNLTGFFI